MPISFSAITNNNKSQVFNQLLQVFFMHPNIKEKSIHVFNPSRCMCFGMFFLRNRHFDHLGFPTFARCWRHSNKLRKLWMLRPLPRQCLGWKDLGFEIEWGNKRMRWRSDRVNGSASKCHWIHKFRGYFSLSLFFESFCANISIYNWPSNKTTSDSAAWQALFSMMSIVQYSMMFSEAKECTLLRKYVAQLSRGG